MWRLCSFVPSWLQKRPKGLFNISMKVETLNIQKPNPRSWTVIKCVGPRWLVDTSTSREHNFCIRTPFKVHDSPLERSIRGEQLLTGPRYAMATLGPRIAKKRHLGPQNGLGSWGPEKLPNWKTTVLSQVDKWATTDFHLDHLSSQCY